MSISALSIAIPAPTGTAASAGLFGADLPLTADGLPINFATLLGGQLTPLTPSDANTLTTVVGEARTQSMLSRSPLSGTRAELTIGRSGQVQNNETSLATSATQPERLATLADLSLPGTPTEQAIRPSDLTASLEETPLATPTTPANPPASLVKLVELKATDASDLEKHQEVVLERANFNAPPLASTQDHPAAPVDGHPAEGVLSLIASQTTSKQANTKKADEKTLSSIDPASVIQVLPPYQNPPLENRRTIDVDRNKQPAFIASADAILTEKPLFASQSNPESKLLNNTNLNTALAPSLDTPKTSADSANLAAPVAGTGNSSSPAFASILSNQAHNANQATAATNAPAVSTAIQDSRWPHEFSERVVWIAKNDQQLAQININPPQLGPVQITVNINGDQASINFASPHAEVRKAIEDAMPNLRDMLASSGISLGQSSVGSQLQQEQRELPAQFANGARVAGENAILPADNLASTSSSSLPIQRGRGLVDLFA